MDDELKKLLSNVCSYGYEYYLINGMTLINVTK